MVKRLLPKARLTYNVQDIFPENAAYIGSAKGIVYKILSAEQRYAYRHADQIITISEDMKELLIEKAQIRKKLRLCITGAILIVCTIMKTYIAKK